jgi:hypothetical protein
MDGQAVLRGIQELEVARKPTGVFDRGPASSLAFPNASITTQPTTQPMKHAANRAGDGNAREQPWMAAFLADVTKPDYLVVTDDSSERVAWLEEGRTIYSFYPDVFVLE